MRLQASINFKVFIISLTIILLISIFYGDKNSKISSLLGFSLTPDQIDQFLDKEMTTLKIPGLSIAIINDNEIVYHRVKGFSDVDKAIPVDNKSIFEGASISKSVFGYFVMTFVEDGLIELDKPLYEYLPNPDIEYDKRYEKITARMVLSHRSGFPNWRDDYPEKKLFIQFEPGTEYHYSGEAYQYLAEVLKEIIGTNWLGLEEEFQKRVAIPFAMRNTKFIQDDYIRSHKVRPYDNEGNWINKDEMQWWKSRESVFVAPTTIHSEAIDFSKWMLAMMSNKGLSEDLFNELFKSHSLVSDGFLKEEYTLGFAKLSAFGVGELYAHSGNNTGFSSYFAFDKDKKWGLVFFTNSESGTQLALSLIYGLLLFGTTLTSIFIGLAVLITVVLFLALKHQLLKN